MRLPTILCLATILCAYSASVRAEAPWPQFRGPTGQGHAAASGLPLRWSETENVAWKTPLPGSGWSSPVVGEDGRIWLTSAVDTPANEQDKAKRLKTNTGSQPLNVAAEVSLRAVCVDGRTGRLVADVELMIEKDPQWVHAMNSYASPTPVLEGDRLFCHFGAYGTACLDTKSLKVVWTNRDLRVMHENGPGSTPVLWKDALIFHLDGSDKQFVAALEKTSGEVLWKTDRSGEMNENPQLQKAYGTPLVVPVDGRDVLVSPGADWLYGYDPATGKELWKVKYGILGFSIVPRPVAGHGMVYTCTTFMKSELLAVRLDTSQPEIAWRFKKQVPSIPSPLLVGDAIYLISNKGIATCVDAKTGEARWTQRVGGNFCSSPLYADGRVYLFSREGVTTVLAPGAEYRELARNELDGSFMASAAVADGGLILRTDKALYRIESGGKVSAK